MTKPYTAADFSSQITHDRNWRIKEMSDLKTAIRRSDQALQQVLRRSLVAIFYVHWEGYVRFSARKYLEHVALRRLPYSDLSQQFFRNHFLPKLAALSVSKTGIRERGMLVDEILSSSGRRFARANDELINTRANLNFDAISDICLVCGVSSAFFAEMKTFIDIVLLKRRNEIAHGQDTFVGSSDIEVIPDNVIALMRAFGDALENHVVLQSYRAEPDTEDVGMAAG